MSAAGDASPGGEFVPARTAPEMEGEPVVELLLALEDAERHRGTWEDIQASFIDDPQASVAAADTLVQTVIADVVRGFDAERTALERQWRAEGEVSTEDLRRALQRYRAFFTRLLEA